MEESVWADLRGNPMTDRGLARRLQPYDIVSKTIRDGNWDTREKTSMTLGRGFYLSPCIPLQPLHPLRRYKRGT
jgi:hypothetical protein